MKQYFYNIYFVFIFISFIFSGCYNERDVSSFDNMTESSEVVYKSNIDNSSYNIQSFSENSSYAENNESIKDSTDKHNNEKKSFNNTNIISHSNLRKDYNNLNITDSSLIHSSLTGTYKIIFFGSQVINSKYSVLGNIVDMYYVSNDCKQAQKLYPAIVNQGIKNQCSLITQSKILDGIVTISYDENNYINITSRLQLEGGIIDNSPADKYQYTVYSPIEDEKILQGMGITNWNYNPLTKSPSAISNSFSRSPFHLTLLDDDLIRIDMTLVDKKIKAVGQNITISAKNTIIIKKISPEYTKLENQVQKKFSR